MEAVANPPDTVCLDDTPADETPSDTAVDRWSELFEALADGRVRALDELYDLAASEVYRLALWRTGSIEDAEDVVQDVFVKIAETGKDLVDVRSPRRWLLTVTHRCAIDSVRRRKRRETESIADVPYLAAVCDDPDRAADARTASGLIGRLPVKQREVVLLRHFADCSFADIGRITGVPTFTAASRHRLAVVRLRRLLEVDDERSV